MFFDKKTLLATLTLFIVAGCATTDNPEQQATINTLETSLANSQALIEEGKAALNNANLAIETSEATIKELKLALKEKNAESTTKKIDKKHFDDKTVLGQSEWVYVSTAKGNFKGRIDTGAATSSINAVDIKRFERDGKKWVRFNLTHAEGEKEQIIEAKIVRIAKITQSSKPGVETERPVVKLHVRIGDVSHLSEFTLTNRLHMEYPVLIGRTFMQDVILVDVSKEYIFPKYQAPAKK